jgi:hypothetical protein
VRFLFIVASFVTIRICARPRLMSFRLWRAARRRFELHGATDMNLAMVLAWLIKLVSLP